VENDNGRESLGERVAALTATVDKLASLMERMPWASGAREARAKGLEPDRE
jgi:hypothetical protein